MKGDVHAWGYNKYGQLGDGTTNNKDRVFGYDGLVFSGIASDESVVSIATSGYHTFAITSQGRIYGWGENNFGQLNGTFTLEILTPVLITFHGLNVNEKVIKFSLGRFYTLMLTNQGRILGLGLNDSGNLGIVVNGRAIVATLIALEIDDSMLSSGESFVDMYTGYETSYAIT